MIMKNKKALNIVINLIVGVMVIVTVFSGNLVSKTIVQNKIQKYIHEVYSSDSEVVRTYFSFYFGGYFSEVKIGNQTITMKFSSNQITDENVADYFQNKFNDDYSTVCEFFADDSLEFPEWIYVYTSVVADGNYSSDFDALNVRQKIYLMGIKNSDKTIAESDSKQMIAKISMHFLDELGSRYNFRSIQASYIDKYGAYEIIIDNKTLTIDELSKNTKKLDSSKIGEEEKVFIESLNSLSV